LHIHASAVLEPSTHQQCSNPPLISSARTLHSSAVLEPLLKSESDRSQEQSTQTRLRASFRGHSGAGLMWCPLRPASSTRSSRPMIQLSGDSGAISRCPRRLLIHSLPTKKTHAPVVPPYHTLGAHSPSVSKFGRNIPKPSASKKSNLQTGISQSPLHPQSIPECHLESSRTFRNRQRPYPQPDLPST
jgi:hypothetical protein